MDNVVINITELPNNVSFQITEDTDNVTINIIEGGGGMQCADLAACQTIIDIEADLNTVASDLAAHESNTSNPHNVTKAQVGLSNVDNTSDINKPVSTAQQTALNLKENVANKVTNFNAPNNTDYATTQATINLVDNRVQSNIKIIGDWDASSGSYPLDDESNTTPFITQWGSTIKAGWAFRVGYGQAGTVGGFDYENGDVVYALLDNAGATPADWGDLDHNLQQATETLRGTGKVITAAIIADETNTDDQRFVTGIKLWQNFWTRVLAITHTFAAKITFSTAPRFSSVTASQYLKVDGTKDLTSVAAIPAADITQDSTHKFVTDTDKTNWNEKSVFQGKYSGKYKTIPFSGIPTSTTGWTGGIIYIPIPINETQTFTAIRQEVTGGIAAQNIRLGVYSDSNGLPNNRLDDSGNLSAVTNGPKDYTFSTPITVNGNSKQIWVAIQSSNNSIALRSILNTICLNYFNGSGVQTSLYYQSQAFGAFPSTATPLVYANSNAPLVSLLMQ